MENKIEETNNVNVENQNVNATTSVSTSVKKTRRKPAAKKISSDANSILVKLFDEKKVEFDFGVLQISKKTFTSLSVFKKEDLAVVIEEALKAIDLESVVNEYDKKVNK